MINYLSLSSRTINLWDLKEDEMWHQKITDKDNETDWVIRSPTYTTAGNMEIDGHNSQVVALCVLSKIEREILDTVSNKFLPIQVSWFFKLDIYTLIYICITNSDSLLFNCILICRYVVWMKKVF